MLSTIRFLFFSDHLKDIENYKETYLNETDNNLRKRALIQIQRALIKCQEIGDEKLQLVSTIIDHIENRTRQLEQDLENLGKIPDQSWKVAQR